MSLNTENFTEIMNFIGPGLPSDLKMTDFKDFGKMTSHIYRSKFFATVQKLVDEGKIQKSSVAPIIYFATLIKNKKRILDGLGNLKAKYSSTTWHPDAVLFYQTQTDQYVSEAEKSGRFPVVNIPSCQPNVAAHFMKMQLKNDGVSRTDTDLFNAFYRNLWFCQLRVSPDMLALHLKWEEEFWNVKVKKSKNPDSSRYERGFNRDYWDTKSEDDYMFIVAGKPVEATMGEAEIIAYLKA